MNENEDIPVIAGHINILPADSHGDILVQLIRGQERSATALELQNKRLFGGDGMPGMLPAIIDQHKQLAQKIDANKDELAGRIEAAKTDLSNKMTEQKEAVDEDIKAVDDKYNSLNVKVNWFAGGISTLTTAAGLVLGYIGLRAKAGH